MRSERITLRNIQPTDTEAIYSYRSRPQVARYQYWEPFTREQAWNFARQYANANLSRRGEWQGWAIVLNGNGELIGDCALKIEDRAAEIGCNISPVYQFNGYATETLRLLIAYLFKETDIALITGIVDSRNTASIRLLGAVGMNRDTGFEEKIWCKKEWSTEHRYVIQRGEWTDDKLVGAEPESSPLFISADKEALVPLSAVPKTGMKRK